MMRTFWWMKDLILIINIQVSEYFSVIMILLQWVVFIRDFFDVSQHLSQISKGTQMHLADKFVFHRNDGLIRMIISSTEVEPQDHLSILFLIKNVYIVFDKSPSTNYHSTMTHDPYVFSKSILSSCDEDMNLVGLKGSTDLERGYGDVRPWRPPFHTSLHPYTLKLQNQFSNTRGFIIG